MSKHFERKGRKPLAITMPSMHKRAALLFDQVFLIEFQLGPGKGAIEEPESGRRFDWLINRARLVPNEPLRALTQDEEDTIFGALGEVAEAIAKSDRRYKDYDLIPMYQSDAAAFPDGELLRTRRPSEVSPKCSRTSLRGNKSWGSGRTRKQWGITAPYDRSYVTVWTRDPSVKPRTSLKKSFDVTKKL